MNTATCHASPIGTLQESAIIPTETASLLMTSRQTKKLATNAPGDNDPVAKEKWTRKRSPRIVVIWMKTLRPNPPKRQRVELAWVTHTRAPKREPFTCSLDPHG
jgi:hypothetical protein